MVDWNSTGNFPTIIEDVTSYGETAKAIKIRVHGKATIEYPDGWRDNIWIPKSQIHDDSEVYENNQTGKLIIPEWLAIRAELI